MPKRSKPVGPGRDRYWAFVADPDLYRIRDAVTRLSTDWWTTKQKPIQIGDRAIIWQARDREGKRGIVALAHVMSAPELRSDVGNPYWVNPDDAREIKERAELRYIQLAAPLWVSGPHRDLLRSLSVARARGGTVFHVTSDQWHAIELAAGVYNSRVEPIDLDIEKIEARRDLTTTQKETLILARRGQGRFRRDLLDYWHGCAVLGCKIESVLRASHIKPWRKSSDKERVDPHNGLLLTANLDALFNEGLITFSDGGEMIISSQLTDHDRSMLGLGSGLSKKTPEDTRAFLKFHRENEFRP